MAPCALVLLVGCDRAEEAITFNTHIAPIVFDHCAACHRPSGAAPFALLSYEDVKQRAQQIADVTESRFMPPWLPEPGNLKFVGERRLNKRQIEIIRQWAEEGTLQGNPADLPEAPAVTQGWHLGQPDLVVRMPEPYTLAADGPDVFRNFVIPVPLDRKRYVKGIEFHPGNKRVVHHLEMLVDRTRWSRQLDSRDPQPGYGGDMSAGRAVWPDGQLVGWTPGNVPEMGREDMAWTLHPGTDLILQLYMQPSGKVEKVQAEVGLYFTDRPPTRKSAMIRIGSQVINIPAGASDYATEGSYVLPVDVEVVSIIPHAHYLGKTMWGWAVLPDGTKKWLIRIADWDFNWQNYYRLADPVFLPRGTTLQMRFTFDNSTANERNPHDPPRRIHWGPETNDEMGDLWIQVSPVAARDLSALLDDYEALELCSGIAALEALLAVDSRQVWAATALTPLYLHAWRPLAARQLLERVIQDDPDDVLANRDLALVLRFQGELDQAMVHLHRTLELEPDQPEGHYNLAQAYREQGKLDDAVRHYLRAIELQPAFSEAHNKLGVTLHAMGRHSEAIDRHRSALAINPDDSKIHLDLARALQAVGQADEAIAHLREAARIVPGDVRVHLHLGMALGLQGQRKSASASIRRALRLEPDSPAAHTAMAWLLATAPSSDGDASEAVRFAEKAAALSKRQDPAALDALATAYAGVGRFEDAVRTASAAVELADQAGREKKAQEIRGRLELFKKRHRYSLLSSEDRGD